MGKKNKHSKDKLHKTVSELRSHHTDTNRDLELSVLHRRLKFDSCCLSLNTVSSKPVGLCDDENYCYVFDCDLIVKFLAKHHVHPITGSKVTASDLIELKFHKNIEEQYHCPINMKLFNQLTKIVANKQTGNVFSYEAYQQLNLKSNNFKDLLTDEPFEKSDIVIIQDPDLANEKWNVSNFYYVRNKLKFDGDEEDANGCNSSSNIRNLNDSTILKSSLDEYKNQSKTIAETFNKIVGQDGTGKSELVELDKINSATYSDGVLASSVTSTVMPVASAQRAALLNQEEILYPRIKKKGYIQLTTNLGAINLELYCDKAPKTCHNFLLLASRGYYDKTCFHRLIKDFIIQGGDPTGTGSGGQSAWGEPFKNECHPELKHNCRGILAMANSGLNTNKSQFYITLRGSWDHLDGKHTVFGRVVGGDDTLARMEAIEVDKKNRPKKEIIILKMTKYVDPFEEMEAIIEEERKQDVARRKSVKKTPLNSESGFVQPLKKFRSGVGAYINLDPLHKAVRSNSRDLSQPSSKEKRDSEDDSTSLTSKLSNFKAKNNTTSSSYGNFSNW